MDIYSKSMEPLIERLSKEHGYSKVAIRGVISVQFEYMKQVMKKVDSYNNFWPSIRLPHFFICKIKEGKKRFLLERSKNKLRNVYIESE